MTQVLEQIPPGTMVLWVGGAAQYAPTKYPAPGWLYCDGGTVSIDTYRALFNVISTRYNTGSEPVGTFRLPGVANFMHKGVAIDTATRVTVPNQHQHNVTVTNPTVNNNTIPNNVTDNHTHSATSNTNDTGTGHNHGTNAGCGNNSAANAGRAVGNANIHIQTHSHGVSTSMNAAGGGHNHSFGFTLGGPLNTATPEFSPHTHNAPTLSYSGSPSNNTTNVASPPQQPTVALWHIIKT